MRIISLAILAAFLFLGFACFAEEPWESSFHPNLMPSKVMQSTHDFNATETAVVTSHIWLRFYQSWLSVLIHSRCRMEPSCSNYSSQAIQRHGALIGVVMTADRLIHEGDEQKIRRIVRSAGKSFCPDPVSNNDFWWNTE